MAKMILYGIVIATLPTKHRSATKSLISKKKRHAIIHSHIHALLPQLVGRSGDLVVQYIEVESRVAANTLASI
jgi:hypothetical protein